MVHKIKSPFVDPNVKVAFRKLSGGLAPDKLKDLIEAEELKPTFSGECHLKCTIPDPFIIQTSQGSKLAGNEIGVHTLVVMDHVYAYEGPIKIDDKIRDGTEIHVPLIFDLTARKLLVASLAFALESDSFDFKVNHRSVIARQKRLLEAWGSLEENISGAQLLCRPEFIALALAYCSGVFNERSYPNDGFSSIYAAENFHVQPEIGGWVTEAIEQIIQNEKLAALVNFGRRKTVEVIAGLLKTFGHERDESE